jgi:hypothetical protein
MATRSFLGNALAIADVWTYTPANPEPGDVFTVSINDKDASYTVIAGDGVDEVVAGLVTAIEALQAQGVGEWREVEVAAGLDANDATALVITGSTAGVPIVVTGSTADSGNFGVTITVLTDGSPGVNQVQTIRLPAATSGGTFTITFSGQTTGNIAWNASAATVLAALEALSNIASGDVIVAKIGLTWTVEFTQAFAATTVPLMTGDGTLLTGAATISHATVTQGKPGTNEVQTLTVSDFSASYRLRIAQLSGTASNTDIIVGVATAASVQAEIEAIIGAGNVLVTSTDPTATSRVYTIAFQGSYGSANITEMIVLADSGTAPTIVTTTQGSATATPEVQTVTLNDGPIAGTYTLTFETETTGAIPFDDSGATIKSELELLTGVTTVTVTKTGTLPNQVVYQVTFDDPGNRDLGQMTSTNSLTGSNVYASITTAASAATDERQRVTLATGTSGGTLTLTYSGQTTANIPWDATAFEVRDALCDLSNIAGTDEVQEVEVVGASSGDLTLDLDGNTTAAIAFDAAASAVQSALEALPNIEVGDVVCAGGPLNTSPVTVTFRANLGRQGVSEMTVVDSTDGTATNTTTTAGVAAEVSVSGNDGGPWTVRFVEGLGSEDVAALTGDGTLLTGGGSQDVTVTNETMATGPNFWSNADNWSGAAVPVNSDDVIIEDTDVPILYGLAQSAVTLASLKIKPTYRGFIGLPERNGNGGYNEYRATYLAISATTIDIDAPNVTRIKIDTGSVQTAITCLATGFSQDEGLPAFLWKGTNASNACNIYAGSFGPAVLAGEVATLLTLKQGHAGDPERDTDVLLGISVTLGTYTKDGGTATVHCGMTTFTQTVGETLFTDAAGAITTANIRGGLVLDASEGTWTTLNVSQGAGYDASRTTKAKTIADTNVYTEGTLFRDPHKRVTFTNDIQWFGRFSLAAFRELDLGANIDFKPAAI